MKIKLYSITTLVLCALAVVGCREPADGDSDADVESRDADGDAHEDTGLEDADQADDADGISEDADQVADADEDQRDPHYCDIANGENVNECSECLPEVTAPVSDALAVMFPNADRVVIEGTGEEAYFIAELESETLGYAFLAEGYGFEGPLTCLTGVDADGWSIRVELTVANPYEWTSMLYDAFWEQFRCLDVEQMEPGSQDWGPYDVDAVSGASISSYAVMESMWASLERHKQITSGD